MDGVRRFDKEFSRLGAYIHMQGDHLLLAIYVCPESSSYVYEGKANHVPFPSGQQQRNNGTWIPEEQSVGPEVMTPCLLLPGFTGFTGSL